MVFANYKIVLDLLGNAVSGRVKSMQNRKGREAPVFRSVGTVLPGTGT